MTDTKQKIFFTADTHFGHQNIIKYTNRPFKTADEMDEKLIENWNNQVGDNDLVYHLGDFALTDAKKVVEIRKRLKGNIILIAGNHEKSAYDAHFKHGPIFDTIKPYYELKHGKHTFVLCHYPIEAWNKQRYNGIHLHGHTHQGLELKENRIDVGVDNKLADYSPILLDDIIEFYLDDNRAEVKRKENIDRARKWKWS